MLAQHKEADVDVTHQDQIKINEFGANNARLHELRQEKKKFQETINQLHDASTEMMMLEDGEVHLMLGESFMLTSEDSAQEFLDKAIENANTSVRILSEEEEKLDSRQSELKKQLYNKFGQSINLEEA